MDPHCIEPRGGSNRKHRSYSSTVLRLLLAHSMPGNLFTESLPSNERLLWLHYYSFQASCNSINKVSFYAQSFK
jgi:hypothetical protein